MQRVNRPRHSWQNVFFLLIAAAVVAADQLSKAWIRDNVATGYMLFDAGIFQIIHINNTGAAFGLFHDQSFILTIVAFVGVVAILLAAFLSRRSFLPIDNMLSRTALGLVLGGTVGNLIDRIRFGQVTDFIDFKVWPAFNVADSAVTIGVIIFAYIILRLTVASKN